jgi:elongation factor Ts
MSKIKELRDMTGAGMMECKKALEECGGDIEKSIAYLRERGITSLKKRANNATNQGNFGIYEDQDKLCIVELLSETDFVSNSQVFKDAADKLAEHLSNGYEQGKTLQEVAPQSVLDSLMTMKENLVLSRVANLSKKDGTVYHYIHNAGQNRIVAAVKLTKAHDQGRSVAVHVACSAPFPVSIKAQDVPHEAILEEVKFGGVDENKARKTLSILEAPYLLDPSKTVAEVLGDAEVVEFIRFKVGS